MFNFNFLNFQSRFMNFPSVLINQFKKFNFLIFFEKNLIKFFFNFFNFLIFLYHFKSTQEQREQVKKQLLFHLILVFLTLVIDQKGSY